MNQDNRVVIEKRLDTSVSFRAIGIELGKDPATIHKQSHRNRTVMYKSKILHMTLSFMLQ